METSGALVLALALPAARGLSVPRQGSGEGVCGLCSGTFLGSTQWRQWRVDSTSRLDLGNRKQVRKEEWWVVVVMVMTGGSMGCVAGGA